MSLAMTKRSLFAILLAGGVLFSAPLGAATWEAHGNICQPDSVDVANVLYSNTGIFNQSTSASVKVHCPIDFNSDLHAGLNTTTISLRYVDRASSGDVSCTLFINLSDGAPLMTSTKTSIGSSSATQTFSWDIGDQVGGNRQIVIQCMVPKASSSSTRSGIRGITLATNV
jgi:hypothetical protein